MNSATMSRPHDQQSKRTAATLFRTATVSLIVFSLLGLSNGACVRAQDEPREPTSDFQEVMAKAEASLKSSNELLQKYKKEEDDRKKQVQADRDRKQRLKWIFTGGLVAVILISKLAAYAINQASSNHPDSN